MSATLQRDQACHLATTNPQKALERARKIAGPWCRAQALSWVARFTDDNPIAIAREAARAALQCDDDYQQSAARAWEIAALAERGFTVEARKSLSEATTLAKDAEPHSSRSEALYLLLQASFSIGMKDATKVHELMRTACPAEEHWRCKRAVRDGARLIAGELQPRSFFR